MAKRNVSADINRPLTVTITGVGGSSGGIAGGGTLPGTLTGTTGNSVVGDRHITLCSWHTRRCWVSRPTTTMRR